jgi:hypothetical protein
MQTVKESDEELLALGKKVRAVDKALAQKESAWLKHQNKVRFELELPEELVHFIDFVASGSRRTRKDVIVYCVAEEIIGALEYVGNNLDHIYDNVWILRRMCNEIETEWSE